jgi:hypothetical protein
MPRLLPWLYRARRAFVGFSRRGAQTLAFRRGRLNDYTPRFPPGQRLLSDPAHSGYARARSGVLSARMITSDDDLATPARTFCERPRTEFMRTYVRIMRDMAASLVSYVGAPAVT